MAFRIFSHPEVGRGRRGERGAPIDQTMMGDFKMETLPGGWGACR